MSEPINHTTDSEMTGGLTRRQVTKAAAWAAPVVALAVATPMAAASAVFPSPTAYITGTLGASGTSSTARTADYSGGALAYNSAGTPGLNSGEITITIYNNRTTQWTINTDVVTAYQNAGWVLVSNTPASTVFIHTPISNGQTVSMPAINWTAPVGSSRPLLGILVSSDNDDVSGQGLSLN